MAAHVQHLGQGCGSYHSSTGSTIIPTFQHSLQPVSYMWLPLIVDQNVKKGKNKTGMQIALCS
jgi:hypothetical protein